MTSAPVLSILLPIFHPKLDYLRESVESVLIQTEVDFELLIVEDEPGVEVARLIGEWNDPRIRHLKRAERGGISRALNAGLAEARGAYIARMDYDDVCEPERLAVQRARLDEDPMLDLVGCNIRVVDEKGAVIGRRIFPESPSEVARTLRMFNCISHPAVMMRRAVLERMRGWADCPHEDYDLWCRMVKSGYCLANEPRPLLRYRLHAGAAKGEDVRRHIIESVRLKYRHFGPAFSVREWLRLAAELGFAALPPSTTMMMIRALMYGVSLKGMIRTVEN